MSILQSQSLGGASRKAGRLFNNLPAFQLNKSLRICEIHSVCEMLLRNVKCALRHVDLFYFT